MKTASLYRDSRSQSSLSGPAARRAERSLHSAVLVPEALESRLFLSASVGASSAGPGAAAVFPSVSVSLNTSTKVLTVTGDNSDEYVIIKRVATGNPASPSYNLEVSQSSSSGSSAVRFSGPESSVAKIVANLNGGNDKLLCPLSIITPTQVPSQPMTLNGGAGKDTLRGGSGNDVMNGGDGNDIMENSLGSDVFAGGPGVDEASFIRNNGVNVTANGIADDGAVSGPGTTADKREGDNVMIDVENLSGSTGNDILTASPVVTTATLWGWQGNDTLIGGGRNDILIGGWDNDLLQGNGGNDSLYGEYGDDTLVGGTGDDILVGGEGNDTLAGGLGNDTYKFGAASVGQTDVIDELAAQGIDTVDFSGLSTAVTVTLDNGLYPTTLATHVNRLVLAKVAGQAAYLENINGGSGDDKLYGNAKENIIHGNGGNDAIAGGLNGDKLFGDSGDDKFYAYDAVTDIIDGGPGTDSLFSADPFDVKLNIP